MRPGFKLQHKEENKMQDVQFKINTVKLAEILGMSHLGASLLVKFFLSKNKHDLKKYKVGTIDSIDCYALSYTQAIGFSKQFNESERLRIFDHFALDEEGRELFNSSADEIF